MASLSTAAWFLGLGELKGTPMVFSHPGRGQARNAGVRFLDRKLPPSDVTVAEGIPVTTPRRTVRSCGPCVRAG